MDHMSGHAHDHPAPGPSRTTDPPARHGMAVIGEQGVYLSHLPMFMRPHDFQVVLEVSLEGSGDPQETYFSDRRSNPQQRLWTLNPLPFVLSGLFPVGDSPPETTSFRGALFRGHFERPDTRPVRIAADVTVRVSNVVHHHRFQPDAAPLEELQYFLFGKGSEVFVAHRITSPPSFDHLLSVSTSEQLSDEDLRKGLVVKLSGRADTAAARIRPGVDAELPAVVEIDGSPRQIQLRPQVEFYFEEGELAEAM